MAENDDLDLGEEKSLKKLVVIIAIVALLLGGGGAAIYFLGLPPFDKQEETAADDEAVEEEEEEPEGPVVKEAHFYEFEPFVVTFPRGRAKLLKVALSVLAYDEGTIETVRKHAPMIRNNLLLLLGRYKPEDLVSVQGKEALREAIAQEIQRVLDIQDEGGSIEAVFFTQFVMQ